MTLNSWSRRNFLSKYHENSDRLDYLYYLCHVILYLLHLGLRYLDLEDQIFNCIILDLSIVLGKPLHHFRFHGVRLDSENWNSESSLIPYNRNNQDYII